jgi:TatD DNase family protein
VIDTHCHLTHPKFLDDLDGVVARAHEAGVSACVTIGTGVEDARRAIDLAARFPGFVSACAGLDPFSAHASGPGFDDAFQQMETLHRGADLAAVGEIGLDYHYDLDPESVQASRFERQLDLAEALGRPVVIHVREAHDDMLAILAAHPRQRGVIHSFTGGPREAERYLELGWLLGFNGVLTFKNADDVRRAAKAAPLDRILVETDAPYLAPVPRRGQRCEPAFVASTLDALARVRGEPVHAVDEATTRNARELFGLVAPAG